MDDSALDWRRLRDSKFALEALALTVFGTLVVLLIGPALAANWLATGAVAGAVYWTLLYDERLDGIRSRFPGERATMLLGFLSVVAIVELLDGDALRTSLVAGFVAGFVVAGVVDTLQQRLVARIRASREDDA